MQSEINVFIQVTDFEVVGKPFEYRSYELRQGYLQNRSGDSKYNTRQPSKDMNSIQCSR